MAPRFPTCLGFRTHLLDGWVGGLCSQRQIEPTFSCGRPLHTSRVGPPWLSSSVEPGAGSLLPLPNEPQEYSLEVMCPLQSPPFANKAPGATGQHVPVTSIQCDGEVREKCPRAACHPGSHCHKRQESLVQWPWEEITP